jgi:hypothetical protein
MSDRDWEAELKKIDRQMEKVSDKAILPPPPMTATPAQKAAVAEQHRATSTFGVFARLSLAVALGVGIIFWPYSARCGFGLAAYLGAVTALIVSGGWSAIWTWRHRAARAHLLSLLLVTWGVVLAATDILPRVGYAIPTAAHPATWGCGP